MDDFIAKPVNPVVVRARVKTHLTLKAQTDLLHSMVFIDGLTGVANRRRFDEVLQIEWHRCRRSNKPLTLLMIDIDHFKRYNDHYGHQAGDACLQQVAAGLKAGLKRAQDLVARYGGEEFVCLMPECDHPAGQTKAEELRAAVAALVVLVWLALAALTAERKNPVAGLVYYGAERGPWPARAAARSRCAAHLVLLL